MASAGSLREKIQTWSLQLDELYLTMTDDLAVNPDDKPLSMLLTLKDEIESEKEGLLQTSTKACLDLKVEAVFNHYLSKSKLISLVSPHQPIAKFQFSATLIKASFEGRLNSLQFLFSHALRRGIPLQEDLGLALSQATRGRQIESLDFLLSQEVEIPLYHLCASLQTAAKNQDLAASDLILNKQAARISPAMLSSIIPMAATILKNPCLALLLRRQREVDPDDLCLAACNLVKLGDHEGLQLLLSEGRMLCEIGLGKALVDAAKPCHIPCIDFLLRCGPISPKHLIKCFIDLARHPHPELLRLLLARGIVLSQHQCAEAAFNACRGGHQSNLALILSEGRTLTTMETGMALHEAAASRHLHLVPLLLADGRTLNDYDLILAYRDAAACGDLNILEFLTAYRRLQVNREYVHALRSALIFKHKHCALYLLRLLERLSDLQYETLLPLAMQIEESEQVQALLHRLNAIYHGRVF